MHLEIELELTAIDLKCRRRDLCRRRVCRRGLKQACAQCLDHLLVGNLGVSGGRSAKTEEHESRDQDRGYGRGSSRTSELVADAAGIEKDSRKEKQGDDPENGKKPLDSKRNQDGMNRLGGGDGSVPSEGDASPFPCRLRGTGLDIGVNIVLKIQGRLIEEAFWDLPLLTKTAEPNPREPPPPEPLDLPSDLASLAYSAIPRA